MTCTFEYPRTRIPAARVATRTAAIAAPTMKLWLLKPIDDRHGPWDPWYDKAFGFVVRASSPAGARAIAADNACNEGPEAWLDPDFSTCRELRSEGPGGLILRDFSAA